MSGLGGGLRDFERRASSCRKGMGENMGVLGADTAEVLMDGWPLAEYVLSASLNGGKASHEDVTSRHFSTARKYLPIYL